MRAGKSPGTSGDIKHQEQPTLNKSNPKNHPIPFNFFPVRNCDNPEMKNDKTTPTQGRYTLSVSVRFRFSSAICVNFIPIHNSSARVSKLFARASELLLRRRLKSCSHNLNSLRV